MQFYAVFGLAMPGPSQIKITRDARQEFQNTNFHHFQGQGIDMGMGEEVS
jgi:hypothetical protein